MFLPQNQNFLSFGVIKAQDARPGQIGLEGLFYPTFINIEGEPVNVMGDDRNPTLSMSLYTGDLGMDDGGPQSVYALDKGNAEQVKKADGTPYRLDLQPGQTAELPDGLGTVSFEKVVPWNKVQISRTPGKFVALAGVVLALIGLLGSLFIRPRRIWVRARRDDDGTLVEVAALDRSGGGDVSGVLAGVVADLEGEPSPQDGRRSRDRRCVGDPQQPGRGRVRSGLLPGPAVPPRGVERPAQAPRSPPRPPSRPGRPTAQWTVQLRSPPAATTSTRTRCGVPPCSGGSASC